MGVAGSCGYVGTQIAAYEIPAVGSAFDFVVGNGQTATNGGPASNYQAVSNNGYIALFAGNSYGFEVFFFFGGAAPVTCACNLVAEIFTL
jgi:hypothetical protein